VKYEFEAPRTCDGDNALELVRRGDLSGSSFTFWSDERSSIRYELLDDDVLLRHVDRIDKVYEMTIAADPAYVETTVTAREVEAAGIKLPNHSKDERETPEQIAEKLRENKSRIDSLRSIANSNTF
jgi:phage head maturation protease